MLMRKTQSSIVQNENVPSSSIENLHVKNQGINSIMMDEINPVEINTAAVHLNDRMVQTYMDFDHRPKLSNILKSSLKKRTEESGNFRIRKPAQGSKEKIIQKFKLEEFSCGICEGLLKKKEMIKMCKCEHVFCNQCLQGYITYKVKMFEEVFCPSEGCTQTICQDTAFYKALPDEIKTKYSKAHQFYITSNDPTLRLCPKEGCNGFIKISQGEQRKCNECKKKFCPKCYFEKHDGNCDTNELDFLEKNLYYKQCDNCKAIIQKTEGCNHITCKCKYEFCYVCGKKWNGQDHRCSQSDGNNAYVQPNQPRQPGIFDNEQLCYCCNCQQSCGETCDSILKIPVKVILTLFWTIFVVLYFVAVPVLALFWYGIIMVYLGICDYAAEFFRSVVDQQGGMKWFFIVLCPIGYLISCFVGIYNSFKENFGILYVQFVQYFWDVTTDGYKSIWN